MDWNYLEDGEAIVWEGRPAPRCYTFRLWKQALAGIVLFLVSSFWLMLALQLRGDGHPWWLALLPLPLIVGSLVFGPLQILLARWRWSGLLYRMTDRRLISTRGGSLLLAEISDVKIKRYAEELASLKIVASDGDSLILYCIECPHLLLNQLSEYCHKLKV